MTASQVADATVVSTFEASHPAPTVDASADAATFAQQTDAAYNYWKIAPISAMLGQWGCSVSQFNDSKQVGGDGVTRTNVSWISTCPTSVDSVPKSQLTQARTVSPDAAYGGCSSAGAYCITSAGTTYPLLTYFKNVLTGNFVGHVTAGEVAPTSACAIGTNLGSTPNQTLAPGSAVTLETYGWVDTKHSDTSVYSTGSIRGDYCLTF
jgi:hypothetical protein